MNPLARFVSRQLREPAGLFGRVVMAPQWNRHNRVPNDRVFEALAPGRGDRIVEVGFGGAYLLGRLVSAVDQGAEGGPSTGSVQSPLRAGGRGLDSPASMAPARGEEAERARHSLVAGVDHSAAMVARAGRVFERALRAGRLTLHCAAAGTLPFAAGSFDKACSVNSIFYWPDLGRGLSELRRVLRPGGLLVLCFTSRAGLQARGFDRLGVRCYEPAEIVGAVAAAGFREAQAADHSDRHRTFHVITARA
jgi:SAM-dependent methyltransferase